MLPSHPERASLFFSVKKKTKPLHSLAFALDLIVKAITIYNKNKRKHTQHSTVGNICSSNTTRKKKLENIKMFAKSSLKK